MDPTVWGPHGWIFLHSITMAYPECPKLDDKVAYKRFFSTLKDVLPCDKCRQHYGDNLVKYPLTDEILESKERLVNWLIDIHNAVNIMNGKPKWTTEQVLAKYDELYSHKTSVYKNLLCLSFFVIIVLSLIIYYLFIKKRFK